MSLARLSTLLAMSYDVIPELRELRAEYYRFWNFVGVIAITGWVLFFVLNRRRTLRPRTGLALLGVAAILGAGLGWELWVALWRRSWGDIGVGDRWLAELAVCILGCTAWLAVGGSLMFCRCWANVAPVHRRVRTPVEDSGGATEETEA